MSIPLDPDNALAYHSRGMLKRDLGRHNEAIEDFDEAIRLDPDIANADRDMFDDEQ